MSDSYHLTSARSTSMSHTSSCSNSRTKVFTCSSDTVLETFLRSSPDFNFTLRSTTDGGTNIIPGFLTTVSQYLLLPKSLKASCHSQLSHCLNFLHTGEIQSPLRLERTQECQFLSSQLFVNQTAHRIDQRFALATFRLLILERKTDRQTTSGGWTVTESGENRCNSAEIRRRVAAKVKFVFLLAHSLFLTCRTCFRSTNSWLNQHTLRASPRLTT